MEKAQLKILESIKIESSLANNFQKFLDEKYSLGLEINRIDTHIQEYRDDVDNHEKLETERIELDDRVKTISNELVKLKDTKILEENREKLDKIKNNLETDIIILSGDSEEFSRNIKSRQEKIDKFGDTGSEASNKIQSFIKEVSDNLEKVKLEVMVVFDP